MEGGVLYPRVQQPVCLTGRIHAVLNEIFKKEPSPSSHFWLHLCDQCLNGNRTCGTVDELLCKWGNIIKNCICDVVGIMDKLHGYCIVQSGKERLHRASQFHDQEFCLDIVCSNVKDLEIFTRELYRHPSNGSVQDDRVVRVDAKFDCGRISYLHLF